MALTEAVSKGRLDGLAALRDVLAAEIDGCESKRDLAALSQRLMDVLSQIEVAEKSKPQEGTALDEFTKRRAEREAARVARADDGRKRRGG